MLKLDSGTTEQLLYRIQQHQTTALEHLTSEVGVRISTYWQPEDFKSEKKYKMFQSLATTHFDVKSTQLMS